MRNWRWLLLVLAVLLAWLQYRFWVGAGTSGEVMTLEAPGAPQTQAHDGWRHRT
ncbi:cell division protein FtsB, partial [Acinetobacter baumannii]|nr:cell division protein FtsB [Acinetobacter baumannii]